jgi:CheY-like chemotaxis protein
MLIRNLFAAAGYRILEAADGLAALTFALTDRPDCILLAPDLPELDGFTVLDRCSKIHGPESCR